MESAEPRWAPIASEHDALHMSHHSLCASPERGHYGAVPKPKASPPSRNASANSLSLSHVRSLSLPGSLDAAYSDAESSSASCAQLEAGAPIDWPSLFVIYTLTVVAEAARGLLLPSTWPYFAAVGGTKDMLGALIASYSFGRMLSTTPLGYLSDTLSASTVLNAASFLQAAGHLMYAVSPSPLWLYTSRAMVGFGSATTSVARAHVTKAIPRRTRTHHFAYLSGLQFVGIAVLPAFGGLMSLLPEINLSPGVQLNGYTYPAHLLCVANLMCIYITTRYYRDPVPVVSPSVSNSTLATVGTSMSRASHSSHMTDTPDIFALAMCLLVNLVFRGVLAELETVTIPFLMEEFRISYSRASIALSLIGVLGVCMYFSFKPIADRFSDRSLVVAGLVFIAVGCVPLSIAALVRHLNMVEYTLLLAFTWSVAYPIGQTAILSLYSKVLTGLNVGGLIGLFSTSGAVSPLVLSVAASMLWDTYGRESVFVFIIGLVGIAMVLMAFAYRRLLPPSI